MASTTIATTHGLTNEQWDAGLFKTYQEGTFFSRFKGTGGKSIVQVKRDLVKKAGDAINFGLSGSIRGASAVTGNSVLGTGDTSNEQSMTYADQRVVIDQVRQGIRLAGKMDEKRVAFNMRNDAKDQLTDWMAYDEDEAIFTAVNTADLVLSTFVTGTGLTYDAIVDMKKEAMFPSTDNIGVSSKTRKIEPVKVDNGEEVFVLLVNPSDASAFRKSTDFKTMNQYAGMRGSTNAIFTGALGMWNNVVVHEHSSVTAGRPVLLGANAVFLAFGDVIMYGEETFDYDNQTGFMIGSVRGVSLAKFLNEADASQGSHGAIRFIIDA